MSIVLRSEDMPVVERVDAIHEAICAGVLPVEIRWDRPADQIDLWCRLATAGPLNFNTARSSDNALWRTARQARSDHEPQVFVAVQGRGSSCISQGDRQTVLRPGDVTIYETTRTYSITNPGLTELHYFQVPRGALALPEGTIDAVAGLRIGPDNNALAAVVAPYFDTLGSTDVLDHPTAAELVAGPSIDLLRALITTHLADEPAAAAPLQGSLVLRVQEYVRRHLADRDLSAATIAAAHHVSVRHLYAELERAGVGLQDTIRSLRLQECRRALRDPASAHLTVSGIGARWGFVDASHFGRVFRREYGMTPREWRAAPG